MKPLLAFAILLFGATADAQVQATVVDGRVSISATNASVREILTEWARVAGITLINPERIPPDRVTLELDAVPEGRALDTLLRAAGGYVASFRTGGKPAESTFARLVILQPSTIKAVPPPPSRVPTVAEQDTPRQRNAREAAAELAGEVPSAAPTAAPVLAAPVDADPADQVVFTSEEGATAPPPPEVQRTMGTRRALETVDPRNFKLPAGMAVPGVPQSKTGGSR